MSDLADAIAIYEHAVGNGQPDELLGAGDRLSAFADDPSLPVADQFQIKALILHLRGVASLGTNDDECVAQCLEDIRELASISSVGAIGAIHAILTFCSFYTKEDTALISEALALFARSEGAGGIGRLETAAAINEIRTHSLAQSHGVPGYSADRVEALTRGLLAEALPPRLEAILADTLSVFYLRLAVGYGDTRFLSQGIALIAPIARRNESGPVCDAALGAIWPLLTAGLEYDARFPIPRDIVARSLQRVREHRSSGRPTDREVGAIAVGLGLRARFDWERYGKRTGVLRSLGYFRIAEQHPNHEVPYATTLRVAYEAGLGEHYLHESRAAFERMRQKPGFRAAPSLDANFASTLMLLGEKTSDLALLARAMELYESAIAREPDTAANISRYINLASAAQFYVRIRGHRKPQDGEIDALLMRGLDAVISMEVLDPPGSTHAGAHLGVATRYYAAFKARLGDEASTLILERTIALFGGKELRWPIGFVRYLARRVVDACDEGEPDCDLLLRCAEMLERAKFLLQVIDLCDGGNVLDGEIDAMFAAAVAMLRHFIGDGRDADGLRVVDRLTAGFVRHVTSGPAIAADATISDILQRAIAGVPLSADDIARIRRSPLSAIEAGHSSPNLLEQLGHVRLDLLQAGGKILALRRSASGLAARLFAGRSGVLSSSDPELIASVADFSAEDEGTLWIGARNFAPVAAHDLFIALRSAIEVRGEGRQVLRHGARSLSEPIVELTWSERGFPPRVIIAHSPSNTARPLTFGFTLTAKIRELGFEVTELALDDCRRDRIAKSLSGGDLIFIVSHGERGASDRILLAGEDYADAQWLLSLGSDLNGKCLFLIACNSGHFNARLTHDDIGLAALALALGARGVLSTLRSVDELSIMLLVLMALSNWRATASLSSALDRARSMMLGFDEAAWGSAVMDFVRGMSIDVATVRSSLGLDDHARLASDRADIDIGWSFVLA